MNEDKAAAAQAKAKGDTVPYGEFFGNVRITGDLLTKETERPWVRTVSADAPHHQYVIWLGCQMLRTAHIAKSLEDVMKHLTVDHVTLGGPSSCCGTVHQRRGDIAVGEAMTRQTVNRFDSFTPEQLLVWCPSCDNHLRIKGEAFETETTKIAKASSTSSPQRSRPRISSMRCRCVWRCTCITGFPNRMRIWRACSASCR